MDAVRTASVSRRWERLVAQLPDLDLCMSALGFLSPIGTPSEERVRSMARTLRRRCRGDDVVKALHLSYRKDVPMECRHAEDFVARANAAKLVLHLQSETDPREQEDADTAWSLQLPPATTELRLVLYSYALRPPRIHGPGVDTLRSLTLHGPTVLCQQGLLLLTGLLLPSLQDLHIAQCTLATSIDITSDAMPRLKHLDITDVSVMTDRTRAAINVLADGLRTLRMSCHMWSATEPPSQRQMFSLRSLFQARFTTYSSFHLRAPRLQVFEWRCCYTDELRIESVGRLSGVAVEIAAGKVTRRFGDEGIRYVTIEQRDKLMTDILHGLMPGLQPRTWKDVKGYYYLICFEIKLYTF
ncbi:hypothetical protein HU200_037257 [Digitaria exilis]|uniref:F-box domain-containing protein n=1 Tax=Digitaria exilis TaxID=1010633 RepID=A0A835BFT4_9POAL|nr:hypothetical protein HU200_037255 [Digitaria exilis]KAF8696350.1 hypothetical protein HU200_037257 [Digitaria exilis]